jgi:hypothetical protein
MHVLDGKRYGTGSVSDAPRTVSEIAPLSRKRIRKLICEPSASRGRAYGLSEFAGSPKARRFFLHQLSEWGLSKARMTRSLKSNIFGGRARPVT